MRSIVLAAPIVCDRMQGREDQMSCLSGGHSNLHSLVITHFPEEYNIRAVAQGSTKSRYIAFCIYVNLTLADNTLVHRNFES